MATGVSRSEALLRHATAAFLKYGYDHLTMSGLAEACGLSRRALYNHFSSKDDAFRAVFRLGSESGITAGLAAGEAALAEGRGAVEVLTAAISERYGVPRRLLNSSPHRVEINDRAFLICKDIMVELAIRFEADLVAMIGELQRRRLMRLRPDVTAAELAQLLTDGARGVGQAIPPITDEEMPGRYASICKAIIRGSAELPA